MGRGRPRHDILLLIPTLAAAQVAPAPELERGDDITAWQILERANEPPPPPQLQAFILAYPHSPLAELAWAELRTTDAFEAFARRNRAVVQPLERSRVTHADRLSTPPSRWSPVPIEVNEPGHADSPQEEPEPRAMWSVRLVGGAAVDDHGLAGAVGVGVGSGAWTGLLRAQLGQVASAELVARLQPESFGVAFVEAGADTHPRGVARVGISLPMLDALSLDTSMGLALGKEGLAPVVRLELAWRLPLTQRSDQESVNR